jgi:phosphate butyryltransferase
MIKNFEELTEAVKKSGRTSIAVAAAEDMDVIQVALECQALADFILIGKLTRVEELIQESGRPFKGEIIDIEDHAEAAKKAVELVKTGKAGNLMKGLLHTGVFLKALLNKETGLNKGRLVSEATIFEKEDGSGLQILTDCAINISPDLMQKKEILENAVELALKLGIEVPKAAVLAAVEVVNPDMPATLDAAALTLMARRGQIKNAVVEGPLAFDNAVDAEAARHKGISGPVAGNADILLAPALESANMLSKALVFWAKKRKAAAVLGIGAPVIMTSRSESLANKILTVTLSAYLASR